ncbi:alpha/beta hydrolase [Robiginitalea sediminis]|uniref:alpha/beta hydrolase n=1 Tax=Robiginitalea sediminis TaxID=1982593 RepID=UPI000B4BBC77|nr:alpha/beta hydrolase [Robiginitalea sediminis]
MSRASVEPFRAFWAGVETAAWWYRPEAPKGVVLLLHGFGEHSGRYRNSVLPVLHESGWAVLAFDWVGHGQTAGKRGYCRGYDQLLDQGVEAFREAKKQYPALPLVLYGHSMGGNLALNLVLRERVNPDGVIASSPYLRLAFRPPAWKWRLGKCLLKVAPGLTLPSGLDPGGISTLAEEVAAYRKDPLVHDRVSPNYSFPVIEAGEWALENASKLEVPTLLLHGTADPIIDPEGSRILHRQSDATHLVVIPGGYHELHHDAGRNAVFKAVSGYLAERCAGDAPVHAP